MEERVFNFSSGPATLPLPVMEQVKEDLLAYPGAGASVMEISHRSKTFAAIHQQAKEDIAALLDLPDNYKVLFIPGGATMQFSMIAWNLLNGGSADYILSGTWAEKAIAEAEKQGTARIAWSGKDDNFVRMPSNADLDLDPNAAYVHYTSNETIQGIEFSGEPEVGDVPLICDASSDFLSRPIDIGKYALLYAGAQKNVGPSGTAVVILREDLLERVPEKLPALLDYKVMADNDSLYNTPPTFTIYMIGLAVKWLRETIGGLDKIAVINQEKAQLLYDVIDNSGGFYRGHAVPEYRSLMNVPFRLPSEEAEAEFIAETTAAGMHGLQGHRSVGGCRASIYYAMTREGCVALRDFMLEFQKKKG